MVVVKLKQFLAELGYTMCWAFGVPKQTLEENFDGYYGVGLYLISFASILFLITLVMFLISIVIKYKK